MNDLFPSPGHILNSILFLIKSKQRLQKSLLIFSRNITDRILLKKSNHGFLLLCNLILYLELIGLGILQVEEEFQTKVDDKLKKKEKLSVGPTKWDPLQKVLLTQLLFLVSILLASAVSRLSFSLSLTATVCYLS